MIQAWKSQEKISHTFQVFTFKKAWTLADFCLLLGFPRKPRKAWEGKKKISKLSTLFLSKIVEFLTYNDILAAMAVPHLESLESLE